MEKDIARQVIRVAFSSAAELQGLFDILKQRCSAEEYKDYARAVAVSIDGITVALINKVLASHPHLADEIEANIAHRPRSLMRWKGTNPNASFLCQLA